MTNDQPESPSFLSQFKPAIPFGEKKLRTTSQLEQDKFCDYVGEVRYYKVEDGWYGKNPKAVMVLTDYTEHDLLPFQDAKGRPIGKASIITTLWDEHCATAEQKDIKAGDFVYLKNLQPKVGRNDTIELNMRGYRGRGYREMHPVVKLEPNDFRVKQLQIRKAKYEQRLIALEEEEEERTRQNIIQTNQDVEGDSSEPLPERQPSHTVKPNRLEPGSTSNQPLPQTQPLLPLRPIKLEPGSVSTQLERSPTPRSSNQILESVSSQPPPQPQPTPTSEPTNFPGLGQRLGTVSHQPPPQSTPTPTPETKSTASRKPGLPIPYKVVTPSTPRLSVNASSSTTSAAITTSRTTQAALQNIQPGVYTPLKREPSLFVEGDEEEKKELDQVLLVKLSRVSSAVIATTSITQPSQDIQPDVDTPIKREPTPLAVVKLEASSQDIQPVVDSLIKHESSPAIKRESTPSIQRESSPFVVVKLEPNCQGSQATASSASAQPRSATAPPCASCTPAPSAQEPVNVRTSPTFVLTEKAKEAKRMGRRFMPLRARVVGFEPRALIDFSGAVCSECRYKYLPMSEQKPPRWCPGCSRYDKVEFKYGFQLTIMDEIDQDYTVKVDDEHATILIGFAAVDLLKDYEKLELMTERLARIGVSSSLDRGEDIFFDLCMQERISHSESREETMGTSQKRTGSTSSDRPAKRHATGDREMDASGPSEPPPLPLAEETNITSTPGRVPTEFAWWLVFTKIMKTERDGIEERNCIEGNERNCEEEHYDCYDYYDARDRAGSGMAYFYHITAQGRTRCNFDPAPQFQVFQLKHLRNAASSTMSWGKDIALDIFQWRTRSTHLLVFVVAPGDPYRSMLAGCPSLQRLVVVVTKLPSLKSSVIQAGLPDSSTFMASLVEWWFPPVDNTIPPLTARVGGLFLLTVDENSRYRVPERPELTSKLK
ncbi:hypothetical protein BGZ47_009894 [Haplosporangium gracile]|nr:hypothetical protein BGZ47_009894 [Haplosporangium gracile]